MLSFENRGLMDPINMDPKYKYKRGTNKLLDQLMINKNLNNNINDKKERLCKSVARNIEKNFWWSNTEGFNEE